MQRFVCYLCGVLIFQNLDEGESQCLLAFQTVLAVVRTIDK